MFILLNSDINKRVGHGLKGQKIIFSAIASVVFVSLIFVLNYSSIYADESIIDVQLAEQETTPFGSNVEVLLTGVSGKGQKASVNNFLFYPDLDSTRINDPGADTFKLNIRFAPGLDSDSFSIKVNGVELSGLYKPISPAGEDIEVNLPVDPEKKRNVIKIKITEAPGPGHESTDRDSLVVNTVTPSP